MEAFDRHARVVLLPLLSVEVVRNRRRGFTRITSKHQATIPVDALRDAGLATGDEVRVTALGPGRILLERQVDVIDRLAGSLPGIWKPGDLERQRDEWDR